MDNAMLLVLLKLTNQLTNLYALTAINLAKLVQALYLHNV